MRGGLPFSEERVPCGSASEISDFLRRCYTDLSDHGFLVTPMKKTPSLRPPGIKTLLLLFLATRFVLSPVFADQGVILLTIEDGDTLLAEVDGKPARLQLMGIDAPEDVRNPKYARDQQRTGLSDETLLALGNAATRYLASLVKPGEEVVVTGELGQPDKYGRYPVNLRRSDGLVLNDAMVAAGFAVLLDRYPLPDDMDARLRRLQEEARTTPIGLWMSHGAAFARWSGQTP